MRAIFVLFTLSFLFAQINAGPANCTEWCGVIFSSAFTDVCGANPDFADETACEAYCTGVNMTMGDDTDIDGNTIGCRVYHANVAVTTGTPNNVHCNHATQTGGGVCGSYCDVYCSIVMNGACSGMFNDVSDCQTACATFPTDGVDIDLSNSTNWGDHVQCRIYHAGAPAISSAATHCPHAYVTGGKVCVSNDDYCVGYCRMFYSSCFGRIPPAYDSVANCVALCQGYATIAPASYMDQTGYLPSDNSIKVASDSVDCRTYHSIAAISDPSTHCAHASIDGGNVCGTECGVYCNLRNMANGICGNQITVTSTGCSSDCASLNTGGNYLTSIGDDTLQCRLYHWSAVYALNDTEHCPHGNVVGSTTCLPTTPVTTPVTPTGSPSSGIVSVAAILSLSIFCLLGLLL